MDVVAGLQECLGSVGGVFLAWRWPRVIWASSTFSPFDPRSEPLVELLPGQGELKRVDGLDREVILSAEFNLL